MAIFVKALRLFAAMSVAYAVIAFQGAPAMADQSSIVQPVTGPHTQADLQANFLNPALRALLSQSSGSTAPANGPGAAPMLGQIWLDTSTTPNTVRQYDGVAWAAVGTINATTHIFTASVSAVTILDPTSFGVGAGALSTISSSSTNYATAYGFDALQNMPAGTLYNTACGYQALQNLNNTLAIANTACGYQAMQFATSAAHNTAFGGHALWNTTTGSGNVGFGANAVQASTSGTNNVGVGTFAMIGAATQTAGCNCPLTGDSNIAVGTYALEYIQGAASQNVAIGSSSGANISTSSQNVVIGHAAMSNAVGTLTGSGNVGIGTNALARLTTTSTSNTVVGNAAGAFILTSNNNTAFGAQALEGTSSVSGSGGAAFGAFSLANISSGSNDTAFGASSCQNLTTGSGNVCIGPVTGASLTTGSSNILIGNSVDAPAAGSNSTLNIGNFFVGNYGNSHFELHGTSVPTLGTGASDCGTSPSAVTGNDSVGRFTIGTGTNGGKCTMSFSVFWSNPPVCHVANETSAARPVFPIGPTTTTLTITASSTLSAGDQISYHCVDFK